MLETRYLEGQPSRFQEACAQALSVVLLAHGHGSQRFARGEGALGWYQLEFRFNNLDYRIEIYPKFVVMHQDDRYFECYMSYEFESESALIKGFSDRLDRYLSGGPWADHDEEGFLKVVRGKLARLFKS